MYLEESSEVPLKTIALEMQRAVGKCRYAGIYTQKSPIDAWIYQELLWELQPDWVVEVGTLYGGSALMLAHILDNIGTGNVLTVDIRNGVSSELVKNHRRITQITGDAVIAFPEVRKRVRKDQKVLVIEDSSHYYNQTLEVLRTYSALVSVGSYLIVEDSNCHHGIPVGPNPGPYEAIETFLVENTAFVPDRTKERYVITWNPKGYLRRVR